MQRLWETLDLSDPEAARDELIEILPQLAAQFGTAAATAAAQWYEGLRGEAVDPASPAGAAAFQVVLADSVPADEVVGTVRAAAGHLFTEDPTPALRMLSGGMQRWTQYGGRQTIARNAEHDPSQPRFARVPTGPTTCAFCMMLASRGWVYTTRETATHQKGTFKLFHDHDDCQIVPEWDRDQTHVEGYDPDDMYQKYLAARRESGSGDPSAILAKMRELFPDDLSDGHKN